MKKRICHISTVHAANDDRIFYKECISLVKEGYEVFFVVPHPKSELIDGVYIQGIEKVEGRLSRLFKAQWNALRSALKTKSEIYHFHDPELMFLGVILKVLGKKVVYDVHEDLPKQILYKPWIKSALIRKVLSKLIYVFEQFSCLFFDGIVSVTDDIALKYKPSKTIILRNLPIIFIVENIDKTTRPKSNEKVVFIYAGGLTRIRGIKEVCDALEPHQDKAELWLLGQWETEEYKAQCVNPNNSNYIKYLGFKTMPEVYQHIQMADVGIAMLYPIKNYLTSLPIKAFEYMALQKPLLMSNFEYWENIFKGAALFADAESVDDISSKINDIIENQSLRTEMGSFGYQKVQEELNWEKEAKKLFSLYNRILDNGNTKN
jgi:glycosyltransferase involved in cell wall biosynthesis